MTKLRGQTEVQLLWRNVSNSRGGGGPAGRRHWLEGYSATAAESCGQACIKAANKEIKGVIRGRNQANSPFL